MQCPYCHSMSTEKLYDVTKISVNIELFGDVGEYLAKPLKISPTLGRILGTTIGSITNTFLDRLVEQSFGMNSKYYCHDCNRSFFKK